MENEVFVEFEVTLDPGQLFVNVEAEAALEAEVSELITVEPPMD